MIFMVGKTQSIFSSDIKPVADAHKNHDDGNKIYFLQFSSQYFFLSNGCKCH